ncbi:MAG: hypothetical protein ACOZCL_02235 [Bacillota bacterium]
MFIKKIRLSGFKNVPDTDIRQFEFFGFTKIQGENFVGKTSIGDALSWVFSGKSSAGITADYILRNDQSQTALVEAEFLDNEENIHILRREMKGSSSTIYLDDIPIKEGDLVEFIGTPELFLSTFMIGYFHRMTPKAAKELLMSVIPFPSHKTIMKRVEAALWQFLPEDADFDSNTFLKQKRSELKPVEDEIKRLSEKKAAAEEKLKNVKPGELIDETVLKERLESLEQRKVNLIKLSSQGVSIGYLEGKIMAVGMEIKKLQNQKSIIHSQQQPKYCPTCRQPIPEEELNKVFENTREQEISIQSQIEKLESEEKELFGRLEEEKGKNRQVSAVQEELAAVEQEIKQLRTEYEKVLIHNQSINSDTAFVEESRRIIKEAEEKLGRLTAERYKINRSITAVTQYNSIKADMQYESVKKNLNNVTIRLQRINYSSGELRDCFEILYKGREYSMLSTSETIRAGLEISNFINLRTGLKLPVFIDNAESITHYDRPPYQLFEAKVMKDAPLTVIPGE